MSFSISHASVVERKMDSVSHEREKGRGNILLSVSLYCDNGGGELGAGRPRGRKEKPLHLKYPEI